MRKSPLPLYFALLLIVGLVTLGILVKTGTVDADFFGYRNIDARVIERDLPTGLPPPTPTATPEPTPVEEEAPKPEEKPAEAAEVKEPEPIELAMKQAPGILRGWVVTETSEYPSGVSVRLEFENLVKDGVKGPELKQETKEAGVFDFNNVPPGKWTIIAEAPGFGAGTFTGVTVQSEQVTENIEVPLPPAIKLTGSVQTIAGTKLEGAKIVLLRKILNITGFESELVRREVPYREVKSNAKGEFTIERAAPGAHVLLASMEGFATERVDIDLLREGKNHVTIELSPAANVGGLVRTVSGMPIGGASIEVVDTTNPTLKADTKSKPDGSFIITGLRANRLYSLTAKAENFAPSGPHEIPAGRMENLIILETGGAITGKVTNLNSGTTVQGIPISLESAGSTYKITAWTKSDSNGMYRFGDLPSGTYNLRIESDDLTSEPKLGVKVKIPQVTKDINFEVYPGETITGIVAESETGTRISNAKVHLSSRIGPEFLTQRKSEAITDEAGSFKVENLPYGLYHLEATADGYLRYPGPEAQADVRLIPGEIVEPVTLLLSPGGTITGRVVDSAGGNVEGAVVQLFNTPGARTRIDTGKFRAVTKTGGHFEITGIPLDNEVNVTASASVSTVAIPQDDKKDGAAMRSLVGRAKGKSDPIILTSFLSTADVTIRLGVGGTLNVYVEDKLGTRIEEANVSISHDAFPGDPAPANWNTVTKTTGLATFFSVPAGGVNVSASKAGYIGAGGRVNITENNTSSITLKLEKGTSLEGIVYDDVGNVVQEGFVDARPMAGARGGGRGNIDNKGHFKIDGVSEGKFALSAYATRQTPTGKHTVRRDVSGASTDADNLIYVPMNGRLDGAVYDQNTLEPITTARVGLSGSYYFNEHSTTGFGSASGTQNPPGEFTFQSIPPGTYRLDISAPNYLPVSIPDLKVENGGTHWAGKIMLSQGATLKGRIISEKTGEPVIGAGVTLKPSGLGAKSGGNGEFSIGSIEPGTYSLQVTHPDYLPRLVELVQIKQAENNNAGVIELRAGGSLYGRVTDGFGGAVIGAVVNVRYPDNDDTRTGRTDAGGRVRMQGLRPGSIIITVTGNFKRGKVTKSFERVISDDSEARFDLTLIGELRLEGSILGPQGGWMSSPTVEVYPLEADDAPVLNGKVSAEINGSYYKIEALVEGRYLIVASGTVNGRSIYFHDVVTMTYPGVNKTLHAPSGQISGRVFSSVTQQPMPGMKVRLRGLSFPQSGVHALRKYWEWTATTDDVGYYIFPSVPQGMYEFVVTQPQSTDSSLEIINLFQSGQRLRHDVLWGN